MNLLKVNTDKLVSGVMLVIAIYMVVEASSFRGEASIFPQLTGGLVILGSLLVLFQDRLPDPIRKSVADTSTLIDVDESQYLSQVDDEDYLEIESPSYPGYRVILTLALLTGYVILSYLISFLFASPVFVAAYTVINRMPWYAVIITTILAFLIPYAFMTALNIPVDRGMLFGGVLW